MVEISGGELMNGLDSRSIQILSLCGGLGGIELGLQLIFGDRARTVCHVERDAFPAACVLARMVEKTLEESLFWDDLTTFDARPWRGKIHLVVAGYPCFAAGTLVLTERGYWPIESLAVGDRVLTHLGRWMPVRSIMRREGAKLRKVDAGGVPGVITTDEHPFYARRGGKVWNNFRRQYERTFSSPEWKHASDLCLEKIYVGQILPQERSKSNNSEFWWVVGRYLADGWRQRSPSQGKKGRAIICCARKEADELERRIRSAGFNPYRNEERTTTRFTITRTAFYEFLEAFGSGAGGKRLPKIALELDEERSRSLLDGYFSGDGFTETNGERRVGSVSKALALGIALLAQRAYGVVAGVRKYIPHETTSIEGRIVNQRPRWVVTIPARNRSAFIDGEYGWKLVRRSEPCGIGAVYNISIDEDESYMADGAIVHNCQPFSFAGRRGGEDDPRHLWPHVARVIRECGPALVFLENVPGHLSLGFREVCEELQGMGYRIAAGVFSAGEVGAPHRRERLFALAHSGSERRQQDAGGPSGDETTDGGAGRDTLESNRDHVASGESSKLAHGNGESGRSEHERKSEEHASESREGSGGVADAHIGEFQGAGRRAEERGGSRSAGEALAHADGERREILGGGGVFDRIGPAHGHDAHGRGESVAHSKGRGRGVRGRAQGDEGYARGGGAVLGDRTPAEGKLAHAAGAGLQERGHSGESELRPEGEAGVDVGPEYSGGGMAHAEGLGSGTFGAGGGGARRASGSDGGGESVGNSDESGLEGWIKSIGERPYELPPWPPGPAQRDYWGRILEQHSDFAPALRAIRKGRGAEEEELEHPEISRQLRKEQSEDGAGGSPGGGTDDPDEAGEGATRGASAPESELRGVVDGLPSGLGGFHASRVDRLRALGNAVVPLVAAYAFVVLAGNLFSGEEHGNGLTSDSIEGNLF